METAQLGQKVKRLGSEKDYTTGRQGTVIALDLGPVRARVRWALEKDGKPVTTCGANTGRGVRTWVNLKYLAPLMLAILLTSCGVTRTAVPVKQVVKKESSELPRYIHSKNH